MIECALGRSGLVHRKREGDGGTPTGRFRLLSRCFRADRGPFPRCRIAGTPITKNSGWCDDPDHAAYNRAVKLPFAGRHEVLWREDSVYDVIFVMDHNIQPRMKKGGSAIFFHIAQDSLTPTEGCIDRKSTRLNSSH